MEMTAEELKEAMKETDTVILSFGAIENHGVHLPLGADYFQANTLIRCVHEALLEMGIRRFPVFRFLLVRRQISLSDRGSIFSATPI